MMNFLCQVRPPKPTFTEADVPDMTGKVCIVTGSNTGIGREVANILYSKNASVYVAARSETKAADAIVNIKEANPSSKGSLQYLHLDLSDLATIKASAMGFLAKENQLHLLINNAGVMNPPAGSRTKQDYELQLGTNCVAPFLFSKLLTPVLKKTAKESPENSVRVVWVSSSGADLLAPKYGMDPENFDNYKDASTTFMYGISKTGNYFHATEFARRYHGDGVISVVSVIHRTALSRASGRCLANDGIAGPIQALNPGNLASELDRHTTGALLLFRKVMTYPTVFGAYTELWAATSPEVTLEKSGDWSEI